MMKFLAIMQAARRGPFLLLIFAGATCADDVKPLIVGETFTIDSRILEEPRRINVYLPRGYKDSPEIRLPILYMPDGGIEEDFLHIAGLVQVSTASGMMRPLILVGIENTQRRRDLTGPTDNANDKKIAPRVGGSRAFRSFIREELMPEVKRRYRASRESAIVGESLAGLFVVETFLEEPELFDAYIAVDPSLWWNDEKLTRGAGVRPDDPTRSDKTLYLVSSGEKGVAEASRRFLEALARGSPSKLHCHHEEMQGEKHATIFHPAAMKAFRAVLGPTAGD